MSIIYFTHIPKTAGSSFATVYLKSNFKKGYLRPEGLREYMFMNVPSIACIHGHFPYGMHTLKMWRKYHYVAFLRSPLERVVSHYFFILQNSSHPFYEKHKAFNIGEISKLSYKYNYSALQNNQQTRFIAGFMAGFWKSTSDANLLRIAKNNLLNKYTFVGFQEKYAESCIRFEELFQVKAIHDNKKYQSTKNKKSIDNNMRIAIENSNQLDLELYDFAEKLFFPRVF